MGVTTVRAYGKKLWCYSLSQSGICVMILTHRLLRLECGVTIMFIVMNGFLVLVMIHC